MKQCSKGRSHRRQGEDKTVLSCLDPVSNF